MVLPLILTPTQLGMIGGPMTYNLSTLFVKLSILSFYLRFSIDRAFRLAVYLVMFVTVGYTVPNAILFLYICKPMAFYWDWTLQGTCVDQQAVFDAANILNMTTDYMILLLPIWMLRPLRAPLLKKIGIALVLMTGGLYVPSPPIILYSFTYSFSPPPASAASAQCA